MKFTLLDFPGKLACTVFTQGCNLRCPFCHNTSLVLPEKLTESISEDDFFSFLDTRCGILEGVAVSGGEPLLHPDIGEFLSRIREFGYTTKLDTNGAFPDRLKQLVSDGLVDYVAMDIKSSPKGYAIASGADALDKIRQSVDFLLSNKVEYEFRTTAVKPIHSTEDFTAIGEWIAGASKYYIQCFVDSGDILGGGGYSAPSDEELLSYLEAVRQYVPNAELRGH